MFTLFRDKQISVFERQTGCPFCATTFIGRKNLFTDPIKSSAVMHAVYIGNRFDFFSGKWCVVALAETGGCLDIGLAL